MVLAIPKTVLDARFAKKEINNKVIRADQLVKYIKAMCEKSKKVAVSDEKTLEWAQSYLDLYKEIVKDYTEKYEMYKINKSESPQEVTPAKGERSESVDVAVSLEETDIFKELKVFQG